MSDKKPKNGSELRDRINDGQNIVYPMSFIYRLVCWCSGARLYLLRQCRSDYNKFFGIGAVVIMTGIMAAISGAYAIFAVFKNTYLALVFGLIWGIMIFFLDWYIVASLRKQNSFGKELVTSFPRILLSIFIAIIISKPLELKLFEKEIQQEISMMKLNKGIAYQDLVDQEFGEISRLNELNDLLRNEISIKEQQRDELFGLIIAEAEGRSPTGTVGKGPVYREKKNQFDKIDRELESLKERNLKQIEQNNTLIVQLNQKRDQKINSGIKTNENYDGFLAQLQAMGNLTESNTQIAIANWFIILLFVLIESSPIIVKLMSKRGPYDEILDAEEEKKRYEALRSIEEIKYQYNADIAVKKDIQNLKHERAYGVQKAFIDNVSDIQVDINSKKLEKWKAKELEKIDVEDIENNALNNIDEIVKKDFTLPS